MDLEHQDSLAQLLAEIEAGCNEGASGCDEGGVGVGAGCDEGASGCDEDGAGCEEGAIKEVDIIKQKLSRRENEFSNKELAYIADNIGEFSEDELVNIPHTYMPGTNRFLVNQTMEIMFILKMVGKMHNINLRELLPVFLKPYNKCFFPTLVKKKQCTQKRRHGCLTCSGHMMLESDTNISEYVERLNESNKKQKNEVSGFDK